MTSQGLGVRTPRERIRASLQPGGCWLIMFLVFTSSHCQPPDPCPVGILLATRALHPLPLFSHQTLLLSSLISWVGSIKKKKTYFQIKLINCEGVKIFRGKRSSLVFHVICIFLFTSRI